MIGAADLHLEPDEGDDQQVAAAREQIRVRGERICRDEYREGVTRLENHMGRPLDRSEQAVLAELAGGLGAALLAGPLQSLSVADDREAEAARSLFVDE
jgi:hypothetical protein